MCLISAFQSEQKLIQRVFQSQYLLKTHICQTLAERLNKDIGVRNPQNTLESLNGLKAYQTEIQCSA